jgi:CHAD domain-containing protein
MPGGHHHHHSVGMNWSTASSGEARSELSRAISAQVTRAREALDLGEDLASTVHEARRAIKRARALLRLVDPWPRNSPTDSTLRDASRLLAVLRDSDVLVLTAEDIRDGAPSSGPNLVPQHLLESLEEERRRRFAEFGSADGPLHAASELLKSVVLEALGTRAPEAVPDPQATEPGGMELLRLGLGASYASVRARSHPEAGEGPVNQPPDQPLDEALDQRSHKLRKRVKDLRYQLEFLDTNGRLGQPKLGRLVTDLHHLTDLLGDRNDLVTLSRYTASAGVLCEAERAALTAHVEEGKQVLRSEAVALSARLFEEQPDSFVLRIEAWVTSPQDPDQGQDQGQDQG